MKGYENIIVAYNNLILFGFKLNLHERRSYNNIFTHFTNCPLKIILLKDKEYIVVILNTI